MELLYSKHGNCPTRHHILPCKPPTSRNELHILCHRQRSLINPLPRRLQTTDNAIRYTSRPDGKTPEVGTLHTSPNIQKSAGTQLEAFPVLTSIHSATREEK